MPESAIPTYILHEPKYRKRLQYFASENNISVLTGFPDYTVEMVKNRPKYKFYNSATMIDTTGVLHENIIRSGLYLLVRGSLS